MGRVGGERESRAAGSTEHVWFLLERGRRGRFGNIQWECLWEPVYSRRAPRQDSVGYWHLNPCVLHSLGTNLSFPAQYITNTLQVNGQCSCDIPIWYITSVFRISRTGFPAVFLVQKIPGTFTVFQVMWPIVCWLGTLWVNLKIS